MQDVARYAYRLVEQCCAHDITCASALRRAARAILPLLCFVAPGLCATHAQTTVSVQGNYPAKAVTLIVPFSPGGPTDIFARAAGRKMGELLGQQFVIANRDGAGGVIGTDLVAKASPDGYTLLWNGSGPLTIEPVYRARLPYDAVRDFSPVTLVASTPNVIAVNPAVPVRTLGELLALARANPGRITFGSTSQGGSPHMSAELLKAMTKVDMVHVPYKGASPMLADLMGGQIQVGFDNLPSTIGHIRSGKVRGIAVTTTRRWPGAPDLPTVAESGVPGYEVSGWFGLLAPAGTPAPILELMQQTIAAALKLPEVSRQMFELGAEPVGNTPEEFARVVAAEVRKWRGVVETVGLKVE